MPSATADMVRSASKDASFWLIVSGNIGVKEIERLIEKLELDQEILADQNDEAGDDVFK